MCVLQKGILSDVGWSDEEKLSFQPQAQKKVSVLDPVEECKRTGPVTVNKCLNSSDEKYA